MTVRRYEPIQRYNDSGVQLSPIAKLLIWAYENPEKALEIGAKIALFGGLMWFLGTLFKT
jgi:hypothetical protein